MSKFLDLAKVHTHSKTVLEFCPGMRATAQNRIIVTIVRSKTATTKTRLEKLIRQQYTQGCMHFNGVFGFCGTPPIKSYNAFLFGGRFQNFACAYHATDEIKADSIGTKKIQRQVDGRQHQVAIPINGSHRQGLRVGNHWEASVQNVGLCTLFPTGQIVPRTAFSAYWGV